MANRSLCRVLLLLLRRQQIRQRQRFKLLALHQIIAKEEDGQTFVSVLEKEYETKSSYRLGQEEHGLVQNLSITLKK